MHTARAEWSPHLIASQRKNDLHFCRLPQLKTAVISRMGQQATTAAAVISDEAARISDKQNYSAVLQMNVLWYRSPYEASGIGHHAIRMILIFSNVVNKGQDELHSGLNQHHIRCREKCVKCRAIQNTFRPACSFHKDQLVKLPGHN